MRILQVVNGFPPMNLAGTEIYVYNLSKELGKKMMSIFSIARALHGIVPGPPENVGGVPVFGMK